MPHHTRQRVAAARAELLGYDSTPTPTPTLSPRLRYRRPFIAYKRCGAIHFLRIGRLNVSWSVSKKPA